MCFLRKFCFKKKCPNIIFIIKGRKAPQTPLQKLFLHRSSIIFRSTDSTLFFASSAIMCGAPQNRFIYKSIILRKDQKAPFCKESLTQAVTDCLFTDCFNLSVTFCTPHSLHNGRLSRAVC